MNKTKCPACTAIQTVRGKADKLNVTCKKCKVMFSAERMGDQYKDAPKKRRQK